MSREGGVWRGSFRLQREERDRTPSNTCMVITLEGSGGGTCTWALSVPHIHVYKYMYMQTHASTRTNERPFSVHYIHVHTQG